VRNPRKEKKSTAQICNSSLDVNYIFASHDYKNKIQIQKIAPSSRLHTCTCTLASCLPKELPPSLLPWTDGVDPVVETGLANKESTIISY
jgi:hypothetical protein